MIEDELRAAANGDDAAFGRLVRRLDRRALNLAWRVLGDLEDARDVRQSAFVRLHGALPSFRDVRGMEAWLWRVVVNLCRDLIRARSASRRREASLARDPEYGAVSPGADADLLRREAGAEVIQALQSLDDAEREALVLRHFHDLPFPEVARILGRPTTTVKSAVARALLRLRDRLTEGTPTPAPPDPELQHEM